MTLKQGIAQTTLILSLGLYIFYLCPFINRSFPLALGMEFWPYVCVIPCFGLGFRLFHPDLRGAATGTRISIAVASTQFYPLVSLVRNAIHWHKTGRVADDVL
ncbi:hypothetical protein [Acaryochloris sp. 'Moss Beach']|uniref:hypothetical protein n=1 Tax=Acaryochloris sp. 'Moss Beach' TaxID=2740837 RepID=UPI001F23AFEA|nr:hypothetical protein [Acaryochloris sp. 'Moss Beach']